MKNFADRCCTENKSTLFIFNSFSSLHEYIAVYEIMCKNGIKADRRKMRIGYGACASFTPNKSTDKTPSICNTYCLSTATVVARTNHAVTLYAHCLTCLDVTSDLFRVLLMLVPVGPQTTSAHSVSMFINLLLPPHKIQHVHL